MADEDKKHNDQFDAALPLPAENAKKPDTKLDKDHNAAADLIRKKVEAIYANEPSARQEEKDIEKSGEHRLSKHQKFIMDLTNSGKPLHEIQMAWHEYYAALPDAEKHEVWNEFYKTHAEASEYKAVTSRDKEKAAHTKKDLVSGSLAWQGSSSRSLSKIRNSLKSAGPSIKVRKQASPLRSMLFGLGIGCLVILIFMFSFFNERFITPFIQPSRNFSSVPLIDGSQTAISDTPELIIPKINVQIPIIFATDNSDNTIETDLESGVVHYAYTAMPGQDGNLVIFGHSSNNIFNPGKYKFAFVLLKRLDSGDTFYIDNQGKRYTYEVFDKKIVPPSNVDVLNPVAGKTATATLITCDPPGTSINRLVVTASQIDPSPSTNSAAPSDSGKAAREAKQIAGNGPTLWQRFVHWFWD